MRKQFRLSEHRGKRNLVLAFYPANREPVSAQQMVTYQVEREKFLARQTEVLGINVDSIMHTTSWEREIGPFDFLLASDFWPHGEVSRRYGVLREVDPFKGAVSAPFSWWIRRERSGSAGSIPWTNFPILRKLQNTLRELART